MNLEKRLANLEKKYGSGEDDIHIICEQFVRPNGTQWLSRVIMMNTTDGKTGSARREDGEADLNFFSRISAAYRDVAGREYDGDLPRELQPHSAKEEQV